MVQAAAHEAGVESGRRAAPAQTRTRGLVLGLALVLLFLAAGQKA
jgi:hypothetical protein